MTQEVNDISAEDLAETFRLLNEIPSIASDISDVVQGVTKKINNGELRIEKGVSFLDLKNWNLLNYISNLAYVILQKLNGNSIVNDPAIKRLAELRVVMEKMRPIDDKLKYQLTKLLGCLSTQTVDTKDPLHFRANPGNLDESDEDEESEEDKQSKLYVPPKISAAYFDEENILEMRKKILEQAQKKALSSSMLHELRSEYDTGPEEIKETSHTYKTKLSEQMKERERYEEEYMTRLPVSKKLRHELKQFSTVTNFKTRFENISALEMDPNDVPLKKHRSRQGKFRGKGKGKKKGFKRKH